MRLLHILCVLVTAASSSCQLPCGGCTRWETCQTTARAACALNQGTAFDVVAVNGSVSSNVTLGQGIPSPKVCLAIGGNEQCSSVQQLSYDPAWHQTLFMAVDGAALLAAPLGFRYVNTGLLSSSDLCDGTVQLQQRWLKDGFHYSCSDGSTVNFSFVNVATGTSPPDGGGAVGDASVADAAP